jgi:hypothetical protein
MRTYRYNAKHFGFEMSIPDGWSASPIVDLIAHLSHVSDSFGSPSGERSDSRTIVSPSGKYLHILITPLSESEPEPTIGQTEEYFDGLTNRQNLNVIATGTINVANREHFWATYYRGFSITLAAGGQMQFFKKYCLYLNRAEYLFTAGLFFVSAGERMPTDQDLRESERVFDAMISSIKLMNA